MSDTLVGLTRKINGADELKSVVRSMKALAASSIGQYEKAVLSLADYEHTVELSLATCLRNRATTALGIAGKDAAMMTVNAVVFGSDQGLVGQFNDELADYVAQTLGPLHGKKAVWAVGERMEARLADSGLSLLGRFAVPTSANAITSLVGQILVAYEAHQHDAIGEGKPHQLYLFYNSSKKSGTRATYDPICHHLLPLDATWAQRLSHLPWPTKNLAEVIGDPVTALRAFIREYLFVSLFKACAESLAAENASRLVAMQRAEKNIDDLVEDLTQTFRRLRQASIDEELFDVISGYESQSRGP